MLIGFKVKNYKSFKELQHFSMIASKVRSNDDHYIEKNNKKILKFSGIYGANGSGKSNLISAMGFIHDLLDFGTSFIISKLYFRGDEILSKEASYFEYEISLNNKLYSYGFEIIISERKIVSEWLIDMTNRDKIIFDRDVINSGYKKSTTLKNKSIINCLEEMRSNSSILFLSEIIRRSSMFNIEDAFITEVNSVYNFFKEDFIVITPDMHKILTYDFTSNQDEKIKILNQLDINIEHLNEDPEDFKNIKNMVPDNVFANIMNSINTMPKTSRMTITIGNNVYIAGIGDNNEPFIKSFSFTHKNCKDKFGTYEESAGTIRIFELLDVIFTKNKVYVIDELDNSLHPLLVKGFLLKYLKTDSNNNQLIVTTHESKTLDFDLIRRDEIWFTEKGDDCASKLYSLEEFKDVARFDKKIDKAYMEGRFGAIANINIDE